MVAGDATRQVLDTSGLWEVLEDSEFIDSILDTGAGDSSHPGAAFLRTCYFSDPLEVRPFMDQLGARTITFARLRRGGRGG